MITTLDEARAFLRNRFPGASDADIDGASYWFLQHSKGPMRDQYRAKAAEAWPPTGMLLRCHHALLCTIPAPPVAPVVWKEPPPTYFSEKAKPIAADLVRRIKEPLEVVIIKAAEALQSCPQTSEHYRSYITDIDASARHAAKELKQVLECRWEGEVSHSTIAQGIVEARTPLNAIVGFSEVILTGHFGPIDERTLACCRELHAAGKELWDKLGRFMDLARIDLGKCERDGEIVSLESALSRGWL